MFTIDVLPIDILANVIIQVPAAAPILVHCSSKLQRNTFAAIKFACNNHNEDQNNTHVFRRMTKIFIGQYTNEHFISTRNSLYIVPHASRLNVTDMTICIDANCHIINTRGLSIVPNKCQSIYLQDIEYISPKLLSLYHFDNALIVTLYLRSI